MSWFIDLLYRAKQNYKLTPQERAILKAIQGAIIGFISFAIPYLLPVIVGNAHLTFSGAIASTLVGAFVAALFKLYFAQNDPQLSAILDAYSKEQERQALQQMVQPGADGSIPALNLVVPMVGAVAQPMKASVSTPPTGGSVIAKTQFSTPPIANQVTTPAMPAVKPLSTEQVMQNFATNIAKGGITLGPSLQSSGTNVADQMTVSTPAMPQQGKDFVPPQLQQG